MSLEDVHTLDEDSGQFYTTYSELLVFGLDENYLHMLPVAYFVYMDLIEIVRPRNYDGELGNLIQKAREICPPATWYQYEKPLTAQCGEAEWFQWVAKEYFDIPYRQSHAYYSKRTFKDMSVVTFKDEE